MKLKYIDFKFNRMCERVDIDLNDHRVKQHLKAVIRGFGSSTEDIVLDFVNNTTSAIEKYDNVQQAWAILDDEQKNIIDGFRSLISKAHLGALDYSFCHYWYCNVVSNRYNYLVIEYEREMDMDLYDIEVEARLAKQAEQEIKLQLTSTDNDLVWTVEVEEL